YGALRRLRRDRVRAQVLRRRPRAVRLGCAVRPGEGADVHPRDDRDRRPAADQRGRAGEDLLEERGAAAQAPLSSSFGAGPYVGVPRASGKCRRSEGQKTNKSKKHLQKEKRAS